MAVTRRSTPVLAAFVAAAAGCSDEIPRGPEFAHYRADPTPFRLVEVLSGKSNAERQEIVAEALRLRAIPFRTEPFQDAGGSSHNIIVESGIGSAILVIAAHTDRVPESPGANDNASCVAVAIAAVEELRRSPPLANVTIRFLFTDSEERGLRGSKAHASMIGSQTIAGAISLELCGIGDSVGIWDVHGPAVSSPVVVALEEGARTLGIYHGLHGRVPRYTSDHASFAAKNISSVGVTTLPRSDEDTLRDYVDHPDRVKWLIPWLRPRIFQSYHNASDAPDTIEPRALDMTARVVATMAVIFNQRIGTTRNTN